MNLTSNVGGWDRNARLIAGVVLIILGLTGLLSGVWAILGYVVAAIAIVTALVRFCPANALLGINSCKTKAGTPQA